MVSVKAINAYFTLHPNTALIVTDAQGKVRFVNENGIKLLHLSDGEILIGTDIKSSITNYNKLTAKYKKEKKVVQYKASIVPHGNDKEPISVNITIPEINEDRSEIDEIVFVIKPE